MSRFEYADLTYLDRELIHNTLAETTARHIVASEGLFSAIDFDPAASPSQMLETTHLHFAPAQFDGPLGINQLATIAAGDLYPAIQAELKRQRAFVSLAERNRKEGKHLFNLTTHQKMIDVAAYDAGWAEATEHDNWQDDSGLGISRGVTTIQAFGMAASEVAQKGGHVFMSFPRTRTIMNLVKVFKERQQDRLKLDPDAKYIDIDLLIETNNRDMRGEIREWLGVDTVVHRVQRLGRHATGKYFNWALSGATYEVTLGDNHRPESVRIGSASRGVVDVLKHGRALPIVLWEQDDPIVEIGEVTEVRNMKDVARIEEWQRATLARRLNLPDEAVTVQEQKAA